MRIGRIGLKAPALVVLGAGATRGASFVKALKGPLPPLDTDFFTQAQRLGEDSGRLVSALVSNVTGIFGRNFALTMEQYLTHVEQMRNVYNDYRTRGRPAKGNPYLDMRDNFLRVLWAVLDESLGWRAKVCDYHKRLVEQLDVQDTLLTFNYDWLIDNTLAHYGQRIWNPTRGYGVALENNRGSAFECWACKRQDGTLCRPRETVLLLKLHGSMNWFPVRDGTRPKLRLRCYHPRGRGSSEFEIVPPEWQKATNTGVYRRLWQRARNKVQAVTNMVFVGYSMPETDLPVRALFMVDARKASTKKLNVLILVNRDPAARRRIRSVLHTRMSHRTRVLTFDTLEDFSGFFSEETTE